MGTASSYSGSSFDEEKFEVVKLGINTKKTLKGEKWGD